MQLIWEAFNLFNGDNISGVRNTLYNVSGTTLTTLTNFQQPTLSSGPRIMQLAVKLRFSRAPTTSPGRFTNRAPTVSWVTARDRVGLRARGFGEERGGQARQQRVARRLEGRELHGGNRLAGRLA